MLILSYTTVLLYQQKLDYHPKKQGNKERGMESSREVLITELRAALQDQDAPGALGSPRSLLCSLALGFPARVVCLSARKPTQSFHGFPLFSSLSISVHRCHPLLCVSVFHSSDFCHSGYRDNERNIGISGWLVLVCLLMVWEEGVEQCCFECVQWGWDFSFLSGCVCEIERGI